MERILQALGRQGGCEVVRELRRTPGLRQTELLTPLGLTEKKKAQLSKLLAPLEAAGVVTRTDGRYYVVDRDATGRLLSAVADVNVSAQRLLAERAQLDVVEAERLADDLRNEAQAPD